MRNFAKSSGFTLVELMITIAILAILMAIVVPNYQLQINKSRRADAKATLMGEAQRLERCFTDLDTFKDCESTNYDPPIPSYKGYYEISATSTNTIVNEESGEETTEKISDISVDTYLLTATAVGDQAGDSQCATFTINNLGEKKAYAQKTEGQPIKETTQECWN
jgi:type IV pilus assembly protein PilE